MGLVASDRSLCPFWVESGVAAQNITLRKVLPDAGYDNIAASIDVEGCAFFPSVISSKATMPTDRIRSSTTV